MSMVLVSPSDTISSHFKKNSKCWKTVKDYSSLTQCHSLLRPWWMGSESHLFLSLFMLVCFTIQFFRRWPFKETSPEILFCSIPFKHFDKKDQKKKKNNIRCQRKRCCENRTICQLKLAQQPSDMQKTFQYLHCSCKTICVLRWSSKRSCGISRSFLFLARLKSIETKSFKN